MGEDLISRLCGEGATPLCRPDVTVSELLYMLAIREGAQEEVEEEEKEERKVRSSDRLGVTEEEEEVRARRHINEQRAPRPP